MHAKHVQVKLILYYSTSEVTKAFARELHAASANAAVTISIRSYVTTGRLLKHSPVSIDTSPRSSSDFSVRDRLDRLRPYDRRVPSCCPARADGFPAAAACSRRSAYRCSAP